MMQTLFDRGDLAPRDRLAALNELFVTGDHPMGITGDEPAFAALARTVDLAAVNVVELTVSPSRVLRTPRMVRQADPELVCVVMASTGRLVVSQAGREAVLRPNDLALYDSSRPFGLRLGAGGSRPRWSARTSRGRGWAYRPTASGSSWPGRFPDRPVWQGCWPISSPG